MRWRAEAAEVFAPIESRLKGPRKFSVAEASNVRLNWFKEWGWLYRPVALPGWLALILTVAFSVQVFTAVDRQHRTQHLAALPAEPFVKPP